MSTNKLTAKQWAEAKEGFGLEEVPADLRQEVQCSMCGFNHRGKLWTDQPLLVGPTKTVRSYQRKRDALVDRLRNNCYCRYHAEQMFGPEECQVCGKPQCVEPARCAAMGGP